MQWAVERLIGTEGLAAEQGNQGVQRARGFGQGWLEEVDALVG